MITTILFDIGDTLVHAAAPATPVDELAVRPVAGALRTLQALSRRYRLGAVTDTSVMTEADVRAALAGSGIGELLEVIVTSRDVGAAKPDPRGVRAALSALGALPEDTLFVGDADVDEAAAAAAGVMFARVVPQAPRVGAAQGAAARGAPRPATTGAARDAALPEPMRESVAAAPARPAAPALPSEGTAEGDRSLSEAVRSAITRIDGPLAAALALVGPIDGAAEERALELQDRLTKPPGALGQLERLGVQLAAIAGEVPPPVPRPAAVAVFAGDHGVVASGVTPWPQEVTAQMVANFVAGGAAINVLARQAGATVTVVDVGVATDLAQLGLADDAPNLVRSNVRRGTADLAVGPAMSTDEARAALDVGAQVAADLVAAGARALVTGEMGIGNTTASAALIAALTDEPPALVTGRGTGIDDEMLEHKIAVIDTAIARLPAGADPVLVLSEVGGLEIAALAGFIVGGASHQVPVVIDGVIAGAALLVARALCPGVLPYVVAGHRSSEPGATVVLERLGLEPVLDMGLRLGEGSGACLALGPLEASALVMREMATFESADVKDAR